MLNSPNCSQEGRVKWLLSLRPLMLFTNDNGMLLINDNYEWNICECGNAIKWSINNHDILPWVDGITDWNIWWYNKSNIRDWNN